MITLQQQYDEWVKTASRLEAIETKLNAGIGVADANVKAELDQIKARLDGLLTVSDAAVHAKIDLMQAKLGAIETKLNGTLNTTATLSGSNVVDNVTNRSEPVTVLVRGIYTSVPSIYIDVPKGARGVIVQTRILAVTGTFGQSDGLAIGLRHFQHNSTYSLGVDLKNKTKAIRAGAIIHQMYPGISKGDSENVSGDNFFVLAGMPLPKRVSLVYEFTGTFNSGEGFDIQTFVTWLA